MPCGACGHETSHVALTTITVQRGATTILFRDVPTHICDHCGDTRQDPEVASALVAQADTAARSCVDLEIRHFGTAPTAV